MRAVQTSKQLIISLRMIVNARPLSVSEYSKVTGTVEKTVRVTIGFPPNASQYQKVLNTRNGDIPPIVLSAFSMEHSIYISFVPNQITPTKNIILVSN